MNQITTIEAAGAAAIGPSPEFLAWITDGRRLVDQRREIDWRLGDWLADGRQRFGEQAEFDFLADALGLEPKRLKEAERVALAFPEHLRAQDVPVEVHAYIAALPEDQRLEKLQQASREHWGTKEARAVVARHKQQEAMFEDEDSTARLATELFRAWNRMPAEAREYAWPLLERARAAGFGAINEDEVTE
jgi:hypothetical protein